MNHVPYRAPVAAIPDLMSGGIHIQFATIAPVLSNGREGNLRALAVGIERRRDGNRSGAAGVPPTPSTADEVKTRMTQDLDMWKGVIANSPSTK
jgi:tripartite-type tricarboxylate transporter receptor subunit TctC